VLVLGSCTGSISVFQSSVPCLAKQPFNFSAPAPAKPMSDSLERVHELRGHDGCVTALALSQDECYLLSAGMDFQIRLWCLRLGQCIANYRSHLKTIWSVRWAETGLYFLSASADCSARLWRTDTHHTLRIYAEHTRDVTLAVFLRNNEYILTASLDKTMRIWEVKNRFSIRVFFTAEPIHRLAIDYSGQYMVTAEQSGQMVLWSLPNGVALNVFNLFHLKKKFDL
jgi:WD40 repeat protein